MSDKQRLSDIAAEVATMFWNAVKETPRQMVAPYLAAFREIVKLAIPAPPGNAHQSTQDQAHHPHPQ